MSYCKIKKADEEEGGGACDLNGNFYLPEDPKNCVLQILSDTLGRNQPPAVSLPFDQTVAVVEQEECTSFPSTRTHFSSTLLSRNQPSAHLMLDEDEDEPENEIGFDIDNDFDHEDVLALPNCSGNCKISESSVSFNPGDTLSSPVPPLARPQTSPGTTVNSRSLSRTQIGSKTVVNRNPTSTLNLNLNQNSDRKFTSSSSRLQNNLLHGQQQQNPSVSNTSTPSVRHAFKQCHLSTVLGSARRCIRQLLFVKDGLASIVSTDDQLSKGKKAPKNQASATKDYVLIATLGEYILNLSRSAFTPAHRLYTSALGLHMAEDLIRNPNDPALLDFKKGHIIRSSWNSIIHTQMKLRFCVDSATEAYHRFGRDANSSSSAASNPSDFNNGNGSGGKSAAAGIEQMMHVMVTLMHAFQDLYATALGSNDIFKVLLHIEDYGEEILQEFLLSLESIERSELLVQVQALRRSFDDIVISMEQLSWAAYVVHRLASGKSLTPSPDDSIPASEQTSDTSTNDYTPNSDTTIPGSTHKSNPLRSSSSSSSSARVKGHGSTNSSTNSSAHRNSAGRGKEKGSTEINPRKSSTSSVNVGRRSSTSSHSQQQNPDHNQNQTNGRGSSSSSTRQNHSSSSSSSKSGWKGQTQNPSSSSSYSNSHLNSKEGKHSKNGSVSSRVSETRTTSAEKSRKVEDSDKSLRSRDKEKERDGSKENHHRSHESTASRIPTPKNSSAGSSSRSKKGSSPTPSSRNSYSSSLSNHSNHVKGHDSRRGTSASSSSSHSGYRDKSRSEKERNSKTELKSKSSSSTSQKHGKSKSRSSSREGRDREKEKVNDKEHRGHSGHRPSSSSSKTSHRESSAAPSSSGSSNHGKSGKEKDAKERHHHSSSSSRSTVK